MSHVHLSSKHFSSFCFVFDISDFGMANHLKQRQYLSHFSGTSYYIAPEVHERRYSILCDIWSLGVILFVLIFGFPPFNG